MVTINVNGLSMVHKGSNGVSIATLPDVCKTPTPGGPVPMPYPNISRTASLAKGSKTVTADGGNMIAIDGSEFSSSNGDEPGNLGGIKSGTFGKESTWLTYSFDVKIEGKGVCRLTDKKMQNHGNTVDLGGVLQAPLAAKPEMVILCEIFCKCKDAPTISVSGKSDLRQECVKKSLQALDNATCDQSTMKPEISYDMTKKPPAPFMHRDGGIDTTMPSEYWQGRAKDIPGYQSGAGMVRRPDVVLVKNPKLPPIQDNIKAIVEMKFPGDRPDPYQIKAYEKIAGGDSNRVIEMNENECECGDRKKQPQESPAPAPAPARAQALERKINYAAIGAGLVAVAAIACLLIPGAEPVGAALLFAM